MKGRHPIPKEIRELTGRGTPNLNEGGANAIPVTQPLSPPDHLSPGAKKCWEDQLPAALAMRVLSSGDLKNLATYCTLIDRMEREGDTLSIPQLCQLANSISKLGSDFGFTPSSRMRVSPIKEATPDTEKVKWFVSEDTNG